MASRTGMMPMVAGQSGGHPQVRNLTRWFGREQPKAEPRPLRADNLTAILLGLGLRQIRWRSVEIARQIYVAVRGPSCGTVLPESVDARLRRRRARPTQT